MMRLFFLSILFFSLALPHVAAAWTPGQPLVTCGTQATDGVECGFAHLVTLVANIIDLGIYIVVMGSAILFAYAGFLYMTAAGNQGQVSKAHHIFLNVAIGLVIALAAWLIVKLIVNILAPGFINLG